MQPAPLPVWHDQCKYWAQYFNIGFIKARLIISDYDHQIRMLFLTHNSRCCFSRTTSNWQVTDAFNKRSHLSNRSRTASRMRGEHEITRVRQRNRTSRVRGKTRDHTCQNRKSYFSKHAVRHEIGRVRTHRSYFSVRDETRDRTCQS